MSSINNFSKTTMNNLLLSITILGFALLQFSCKKDKVKEINQHAIWDCHEEQNPDSASFAAKLAGSWKWTTMHCFWSDTTVKADKEVRVTFTENGNFYVKENNIVITEGNWKLKHAAWGDWELDTDQYSKYLSGTVLNCDNQLLFYYSYLDGCDYLFKRLK
jgi:hypothetical protein